VLFAKVIFPIDQPRIRSDLRSLHLFPGNTWVHTNNQETPTIFTQACTNGEDTLCPLFTKAQPKLGRTLNTLPIKLCRSQCGALRGIHIVVLQGWTDQGRNLENAAALWLELG
jgi:hypothetical protein